MAKARNRLFLCSAGFVPSFAYGHLFPNRLHQEVLASTPRLIRHYCFAASALFCRGKCCTFRCPRVAVSECLALPGFCRNHSRFCFRVFSASGLISDLLRDQSRLVEVSLPEPVVVAPAVEPVAEVVRVRVCVCRMWNDYRRW